MPWLLARRKKKHLLLRLLKQPHRQLTLLHRLPLRPLTLLLLLPLRLLTLLLPQLLTLLPPLPLLLPQLPKLLRLLPLLRPSNIGWPSSDGADKKKPPFRAVFVFVAVFCGRGFNTPP